MIKTTEYMRDNYVKHINKLEDYAKGDFKDPECYMCTATRTFNDGPMNCSRCPINKPIDGEHYCAGGMRRLNLETKLGRPTSMYNNATPKSIRKHILWIEKWIAERTDCIMYWKNS